jgi:hypothetical protein
MKTRDRWSDRWRDGDERRRRLAIMIGQRGRRAAQGNGARAAKVRTRAVEQVPCTDWMARTARRRASRGGGASRLPDQGQSESPINLVPKVGGIILGQHSGTIPSIGIAPRTLKNFANQVKAQAIDALLENAIIAASWRDGDGGVCYIIPRVVRLERATCAASGFGGGLLVLPALPHSTPDRHAVVRPCTPLALYSHYTCRRIQGIATSYMQLRAWPRRMQIAFILIPCPWPRCSPSPPSPPRQLRAGHDSSSPRLSRSRRPPCRHSTAARPGPTDRHYSDR